MPGYTVSGYIHYGRTSYRISTDHLQHIDPTAPDAIKSVAEAMSAQGGWTVAELSQILKRIVRKSSLGGLCPAGVVVQCDHFTIDFSEDRGKVS